MGKLASNTKAIPFFPTLIFTRTYHTFTKWRLFSLKNDPDLQYSQSYISHYIHILEQKIIHNLLNFMLCKCLVQTLCVMYRKSILSFVFPINPKKPGRGHCVLNGVLRRHFLGIKMLQWNKSLRSFTSNLGSFWSPCSTPSERNVWK